VQRGERGSLGERKITLFKAAVGKSFGSPRWSSFFFEGEENGKKVERGFQASMESTPGKERVERRCEDVKKGSYENVRKS